MDAGLVRALISIPFFNIGGVDAKNIESKWTVTDNGQNVESLEDGSKGYIRGKPWNLQIQHILSKDASYIGYNAVIGNSGSGMLKLSIDYNYTDAVTGHRYTDQYKGWVVYATKKDGSSRRYSLVSTT